MVVSVTDAFLGSAGVKKAAKATAETQRRGELLVRTARRQDLEDGWLSAFEDSVAAFSFTVLVKSENGRTSCLIPVSLCASASPRLFDLR